MNEITLYNTLTREKAAFTPLDPESIRIYACGPTVYDRAHIGNARPVVSQSPISTSCPKDRTWSRAA